MFNTQQFNNGNFNGENFAPSTVQSIISYNGFSLVDSSYSVYAADFDGVPTIDIVGFEKSQADGGGILSRYYREKKIKLEGSIKGTSAADLNSKIDELKNRLGIVDGFLVVKFGDDYRQIKATVTSLEIPRVNYNIDYIKYSVEFVCKRPFFMEQGSTATSFLSMTTALQAEIVNYGTAPAFPKIYISFQSATSISNIAIRVGSNFIYFNQAIGNGSVIIIDRELGSVTYNGNEVDYFGTIDMMQPGSNQVYVVPNNTNPRVGAFIMDVSVIYQKSYK